MRLYESRTSSHIHFDETLGVTNLDLQSFELQRILEGEKAQRTETARLLQETQRRVAAGADGPAKEALSTKAADLQEKLRQQSSQASVQLSLTYLSIARPSATLSKPYIAQA